jgi:hypothetical protein
MLHGGKSRNMAHVDCSLFPLSAPLPATRGADQRSGTEWGGVLCGRCCLPSFRVYAPCLGTIEPIP